MEIIRSQVPAEVAGEALSEVLCKYSHRPVLLMLSGGSALNLLDYVVGDCLGSNVTLTVLDERCTTDSESNNFTLLTKTQFFNSCMQKGVSIISTKVESGDVCTDVAKRWERSLHDWKIKFPTGAVVATVGIGTDGHIAGIMPRIQEVNFFSEDWVVSYTVPKKVNQHQQRITTTATFITECVDEVIVYATGKEKWPHINRLEQRVGNKKIELPVDILGSLKGVQIHTDGVSGAR